MSSTTLWKSAGCACEILEQLDTHGEVSLRIEPCWTIHKTELECYKLMREAMLNEHTQLEARIETLENAILTAKGHYLRTGIIDFTLVDDALLDTDTVTE